MGSLQRLRVVDLDPDTISPEPNVEAGAEARVRAK
jgi:hypothetical protein